MNIKSEKNRILASVFDQQASVYRRNLRRYTYKIAEAYWAYTILNLKKNRTTFISTYNNLLQYQSELFYDTLKFLHDSLERFNGEDRDVINTYRGDKKLFAETFNDQLNLKINLYKYLVDISDSLKTAKNPIPINYKIKSHPEPYLPRSEQIFWGLNTLSPVKTTNYEIEWPYQRLPKSTLRKLQNFGEEIFYHNILETVAGELETFDKTGGMAFLPFKKVNSEVDAVYDFLPKFYNLFDLEPPQIGYKISLKYRNKDGKKLHPETINRNILRYYESAK